MKCVPLTKASSSSSRSMLESADITWPRGRWLEKPFAKVFTGPPRYEMQRRSSVGVRDANSMLGKLICRHKSFKPSPSPSRSWSGASTW